MAVVVESNLGWFVDHQLSIDDTYKCTEVGKNKNDILTEEERELVQQRRGMTRRRNELGLINYKSKPDLFAIWQPFVMDSHFNGKTKEKDTNSFSIEGSEASAEIESLTSVACHAFHEKTKATVPAVPLASPVSHDDLQIRLTIQQKIGTHCYNRKVGNNKFY